jgi:hypothetical protein
MMITNFSLTAWLAGAGGQDRAKENPILPLAMGLKILMDVGASLKLATEEWGEQRAFCEYCQVATLCSIASLALAVPEIVSALDALNANQNVGDKVLS